MKEEVTVGDNSRKTEYWRVERTVNAKLIKNSMNVSDYHYLAIRIKKKTNGIR